MKECDLVIKLGFIAFVNSDRKNSALQKAEFSFVIFDEGL